MEDFVLKYDKTVALKTGALSYKLYVFMLWVYALILFISSAIFEVVCYFKGMSSPIISIYTSKIVFTSLFILLIWLFAFPIWFPAHIAENLVFVKKGDKFYRLQNKKDNSIDREKHLENSEFLEKVIQKLPKKNVNIKVEQFENMKVLRKTKKIAILEVTDEEETVKKMKIYNIYDNFDKLQ